MPVYCLPGGATDSETNRRKPAREHVALNDFLRHLIICFEEEHPKWFSRVISFVLDQEQAEQDTQRLGRSGTDRCPQKCGGR